MTWDAARHGTRFEIPFFLFHGASDQHTLTSLATEYFDTIQAPVKELALIPGGGHCAVLMQPEALLEHLRARVIPAAASATPA
jgi:pimeloyl-ACP methyl ester carboxylesterase